MRLPLRVSAWYSLFRCHRELDVLHIPECRSSVARIAHQLRVDAAGIASSMRTSPGLPRASDIGCGVRMPATTSSPCAFTKILTVKHVLPG